MGKARRQDRSDIEFIQRRELEGRMMPKKERTTKKRALDTAWEALGVKPMYLSALTEKSVAEINRDISNAGIYTGGLVTDEGGDMVLHPKTGTGANDMRAADRSDTAKELRSRHSDIWGQRGAAGVIVRRENKSTQKVFYTEDTIRGYIRDFPI